MTISELTLAGFKGIAQTAHTPPAPITLLFGANSAGEQLSLVGTIWQSHP